MERYYEAKAMAEAEETVISVVDLAYFKKM